MRVKWQQISALLQVFTLLVVAILGLVWQTNLTARSAPLDTRPQVTPIPRPAVHSGTNTHANSNQRMGGHIALFWDDPDKDVWTVVEWQDNYGNWHPVNGWQGKPQNNRIVRWWVAPKDLGMGPFRWYVSDNGAEGERLWVSEPFFLPAEGATLRITVVPSGS